MRFPFRIAGLAALAIIAFDTAHAQQATTPPAPAPPAPILRADARIDFANHGGIYDWRADGRDALLVESRDGRYFRATLLASCFPLPFATQVGFVTDTRDVLDKFGAIDVGHEHCTFTSFSQIPKPEKW